MQHPLSKGLVAMALALLAGAAAADDIHVAVASNFAAPMQRIAADFEKHTGHRAQLAFGSTGKFYAQIKHGAPFELFLAADDETPARLVKEGAAVQGSRFTYAIGRLVLWSPRPGVVDDQGAVLKRPDSTRVAYANPKLAPYGAAAVEALQALGVFEALQPRLIQGENIGQAHQFVASGNAALGFVALSQVMRDGRIADGSAWVVPPHLHTPIRQDAVVLDKGRDRTAVAELVQYLKSDQARAVIRAYGYDP